MEYGEVRREIIIWVNGGMDLLMVLGNTFGTMETSYISTISNSFVGELMESLKHGYGCEDF